jgi:hypothetical protein
MYKICIHYGKKMTEPYKLYLMNEGSRGYFTNSDDEIIDFPFCAMLRPFPNVIRDRHPQKIEVGQRVAMFAPGEIRKPTYPTEMEVSLIFPLSTDEFKKMYHPPILRLYLVEGSIAFGNREFPRRIIATNNENVVYSEKDVLFERVIPQALFNVSENRFGDETYPIGSRVVSRDIYCPGISREIGEVVNYQEITLEEYVEVCMQHDSELRDANELRSQVSFRHIVSPQIRRTVPNVSSAEGILRELRGIGSPETLEEMFRIKFFGGGR